MKLLFLTILRIVLLLIGLNPHFGNAQITIDNTLYSTTQLVNGVLVPAGSGTAVSNVVFQGVYNVSGKYQVGYFTTATTTLAQLGFSSGVVLSTGSTSDIPLTLGTDPGSAGQMSTGYASTCTNGEIRQTGSCPVYINDVDVLAGPSNYFNAVILEFDFIPVDTFVRFRYVFGSEEYSDNGGFTNYQCSSYNDKFGFLISGPGINGSQGYTNNARNIALLTNGSEVSINSVNDGTVGSSGGAPSASNCVAANPDWIQNVSTPEFLGTIDGTELNGNTIILTAWQNGLTPGQTYHIKLIVTDVGDAAYDAVVYLEAGSFTTEPTANAGPDQTICADSTMLNATSPATGSWSILSGSGLFTNSVSPTTSVTGLAIGENVLQWSDGTSSATVTIIVNSNSSPASAGSDIIQCIDSAFMMGANSPSGSSSGAWSVISGSVSPLTSSNPTEVFVLTGTTATLAWTISTPGCPSTSDTIIITNNSGNAPITGFSFTTPVCTNGSNPVPLAVGGFTNGGIFSSTAGLSINASSGEIDLSTSTSGIYTVIYSVSSSGCTTSGSSTFEITIASNPVITSFSSGMITCSNASVTLTATSPGCTIVWNGGALANAANPATVNAAGNYSATATDTANGCTNTSTITVTSDTTSPTITSLASGNITCNATSVVLTGTSAGSTILWNGGALTNAANPATVNASGNYSATATDTANGCTNISTVTVTSDTTSPTITSVASGNITCNTTSVVLTGTSPGSTIVWNGGSLSNAANPATVNAAGNFSATATDTANGCSNISTVTVTNDTTSPVITALSSGNITCNTTSVVLTGTSAGSTILWNGGVLINSANPATVTVAGNYYATATDTANGCTNISTVTVTSDTASPTITSVTSGNITCNTTSVVLTGTSPGIIIVWNGGALTNAANPATVNAAGNYSATATDTANGCSSTSSLAVTSNNNVPDLSPGPSDTINCITGIAGLSANSTTLGITYNWSGPGIVAGFTTSMITVNLPGNYLVMVTDTANDCKSTATVSVAENTAPIADAGNDVTITSGSSATLIATGGETYFWNTGETINPLIVSPEISTFYCVTATDARGCSDTACVNVFVDILCGEIFVPTAFSPNNDGFNDVFRVKVNPFCVLEMRLLVYDRWGEKIIEFTDPKQFWDGTYKGKLLDNGVFVYYLTMTLTNSSDPVQLSGNVSLLR